MLSPQIANLSMLRKPQVYLDSSDFSLLTDPRRLDEKMVVLRTKLQRYADTSQVQFRFSIVHVCEAAPIGREAQEAAERRAELIYRLCGTNTLVTTEEIREAEIKGGEDFCPYSMGRWYPPLDDLLPESPLSDMKQMLSKELKTKGLTREQRREKEREVFDKNGLTKKALKLMEVSAPNVVQELLRVFPFQPYETEALMNYLRGKQGRDIAMKACHRVLANPTWIMGRFAAPSSDMEGVTAWLRQGSSDFVERVKATISKAHDFYQSKNIYIAQRKSEISATEDLEIQAEQFRDLESYQQVLTSQMANMLGRLEESILRKCVFGEKDGHDNEDLLISDIRAKYPGIAAFVEAGVHAMKRAVQETQARPLKASDFGDAMHAFYAPYVDIYRTDMFMADAVTKVLKDRGTKVARRLTDVPALIEQCLNNDTPT